MVKLHNAFPARTGHPAVGELDAGARKLDHGPDQQEADENSVRKQSRREAVQEILQLSSGKDAKTNDHVDGTQLC